MDVAADIDSLRSPLAGRPSGQSISASLRFRESLTAAMFVSIDEVVTAVMNVKPGMFPTEQIAEFARADQFPFTQDGEEAMAKQLGHRADGSLRQAVKAPVGGKQAVADEHVEMRMEDEVIAKSMNCGDCPEFAFSKTKLQTK